MHRVGPDPDTVSYAAAISTCGKAARWQLALGLLRAARHWPGARRRLLQHCHQRLREGCPVAPSTRVLTLLPRVGLEPSTVSYNAAISA
eukprot:6389681-Lingulodinium_polyedra.AAC.2